MAKIKVLYEKFPSVNNLIATLATRENNKVMRGCHSSERNGYSFTMTESYKDAVALSRKGFDEAAQKIRADIAQKNKIQSKYAAMVKHPTPHNAVVGYIPNVPNAIRNIPESMITKDKIVQKRKTLNVIYSEHGNCGRDTDYFVAAGSAMLSAVDLIEKSGIQVRIDLAFMTSISGSELTFPTVRIKNYDERFSFQKVSFPIAHPSMFRRIGFKWLETTPQITERGYNSGYGHAPTGDSESPEKVLDLPPNTYYVDSDWITDHNHSVEAILRKLEVI